MGVCRPLVAAAPTRWRPGNSGWPGFGGEHGERRGGAPGAPPPPRLNPASVSPPAIPSCIGGNASTADTIKKATVAFHLKKLVGPVRRALIYGLISYGGLVLINNSELDLPSMWIAYLPMFVGVYVVTQWLDKKLGE